MRLSNLDSTEIKELCRFITITEFKKIFKKKIQQYPVTALKCFGKSIDRVQKNDIEKYINENISNESDKVLKLIEEMLSLQFSLGLDDYKSMCDYFDDVSDDNLNSDDQMYIAFNDEYNASKLKIPFDIFTKMHCKKSESQQKEDKLEKAEKANQKLTEDLKKANEEIKKLKSDLTSTKTDYKKSNSDHKKEVSDLKKQMSEAKKEAGESKKHLEDVEKEVENLKKQLSDSKNTVDLNLKLETENKELLRYKTAFEVESVKKNISSILESSLTSNSYLDVYKELTDFEQKLINNKDYKKAGEALAAKYAVLKAMEVENDNQ